MVIKKFLFPIAGIIGVTSLITPSSFFGKPISKSKDSSESVISSKPDSVTQTKQSEPEELKELNKDRHCVQLGLGQLPNNLAGLYACPPISSTYGVATFYLVEKGFNDVRTGKQAKSIEAKKLSDSAGNYQFTLSFVDNSDPIFWNTTSTLVSNKDIESIFAIGLQDIEDTLEINFSDCTFSGVNSFMCGLPSF